MKIRLVNIDDSLISIGARRVAAFIRQLNPDTVLCHLALSRYRSFREVVLARDPAELDVADQARRMVEPLADADIVAFSSMTHVAQQTKALIAQLRRVNPRVFVVWGGIHPILAPEDAIGWADAICTGEGEPAFAEFFQAFRGGRDYTRTRNFWFNIDGRIIRNDRRPLMTPAEMEDLPLPTYGEGELLYRPETGAYTPLTPGDYIRRVGLAYNTVWSIGCPFRCTYCGNSRFIDNDPAYAKLRYPSPRRVVEEILAARRVHRHISTVVFEDDSLLALPVDVLEEFGRLFRRRVGLPFCVGGVLPNYVRRGKLEILLEAGLNRIRMGIQSGSPRILDFYNRRTPPHRILQAASVIADYTRYMIPPAYDLILDNPVETSADLLDTLDLVRRLPRPFTCNLFSLRVQPNTELVGQFEKLGISATGITHNYHGLFPSLANCLLVLLILVRLPRSVRDRLNRWIKPVGAPQRTYPRLLLLLRFLLLVRRAWNHLRFMDFSIMPGRLAWLLHRCGLVGFWRQRMVRPFTRPVSSATADSFAPPIAPDRAGARGPAPTPAGGRLAYESSVRKREVRRPAGPHHAACAQPAPKHRPRFSP